MKKLFASIFNAGTEGLEKDIANKVFISNVVGLVFANLIALPFVIITYIQNPWLTWVPVVASIVTNIAILINKYGFNQIGRAIISVFPPLLITVYNTFLTQEGELVGHQVTLNLFAFSLVPFLVFTFKEKAHLYGLMLINALMLFFINEICWSVETEEVINREVFTNPFILKFVMFISISIGFLSVGLLSFLSFKSANETQSVLDDLAKRESEMTAQKEELQKTLDEIEANKEIESKRNWANDGMVEFGQIMRNNSGQALYSKLINGMVEYLDAKLGAIYEVVQDHSGETYISMRAAYAYDREKFLESNQIMPGEGLIGQCYLEAKKIYLTNVPQGFPKIKSGLGDETPNAVIIVPLMNEDKVEGIIEFAGFRKYEEYEIEFIEKLGETIATTINRDKVNSRTQLLLTESREQSEMMQQQEEEMRQNMEEMQATQDMMDQKENEYLDEIKDLKKQIRELKS